MLSLAKACFRPANDHAFATARKHGTHKFNCDRSLAPTVRFTRLGGRWRAAIVLIPFPINTCAPFRKKSLPPTWKMQLVTLCAQSTYSYYSKTIGIVLDLVPFVCYTPPGVLGAGLTCTPKTGPFKMRVFRVDWGFQTGGRDHAEEPVFGGADHWGAEGAGGSVARVTRSQPQCGLPVATEGWPVPERTTRGRRIRLC